MYSAEYDLCVCVCSACAHAMCVWCMRVCLFVHTYTFVSPTVVVMCAMVHIVQLIKCVVCKADSSAWIICVSPSVIMSDIALHTSALQSLGKAVLNMLETPLKRL